MAKAKVSIKIQNGRARVSLPTGGILLLKEKEVDRALSGQGGKGKPPLSPERKWIYKQVKKAFAESE